MTAVAAGNSLALEDVEIRSAEFPKTFIIPARAVRRSLKVGDEVKLVFGGVERMWVEIAAVSSMPFKRKYLGRLIDRPVTLYRSISFGDSVRFSPKHIASVHRPGVGDLS